ncbi:hypothetical protein KDL28_31280 [Pseudonocardia sp. S2-4]|uniref:Flavoprotein domain-containing protein n=1 Tax=Pseudonocardia humida TaxID=2800819 RepID=A0ABT1A9B0_9PSEU|nr:hypothetical protein [Pseudonocardia humida]
MASRAADVRDSLVDRWSVSVVVSGAAGQWCAVPTTVERPRPDTVVACPLTFNSADKVVAGIMDTPATGVLCDAIGAGAPIVAVPMVNDRLWGHPVWASTLRDLRAAGVRMIDVRTGEVGTPRAVVSGTGPDVVGAFQVSRVIDALG